MSHFTASPFVRAALAGSLTQEDMRGDYARARAAAEAQLAEASEGGDLRQRAGAYLTRGMVRLFQGEPGGAQVDLAEAQRLAGGEADLRALAFAYSTLALRGRFQTFPGGAGGATLEIDSRWSLADATLAEEQSWSEIGPALADPVPRLEADLAFQFLRYLPLYRQLLDGSYAVPRARAVQQSGMILSRVLSFRSGAEHQGASPTLLAWLDQGIADLYWRLGDPALAQRRLLDAHDGFEREADSVGIAACRTMLGDWRSASVSSPLIWNLLLQEGIGDSSLSPFRERFERTGGAVDIASGTQLYDEAEALLRDAGERRGLGMLALRRGYLHLLSRDFAAVVGQAERAYEMLAAAGDGYGVKLAQAHRILGRIGLSQAEEVEEAERIGRWGSGEGSFAFATGLGLLFARMGWRWLREGDYERALACFRSAQALFEALGALGDAARTLADQGGLYLLAGEQAASILAYEGARDRFLARATARPGLATAAWQQALHAADKVLLLQLRHQEAVGLERSAAVLRELRDRRPPPDASDLHGPGFRDVPERLIADRLASLAVFIPLCRARQALDEGNSEKAGPYLDAALAAVHADGLSGRDFLEAQVLGVARRFPEASAAFDRFQEAHGSGGTFQEELIERVSQSFGPGGEAVAEERPLWRQELAAGFFVRVRDYERAEHCLEEILAMAGPDWWQSSERPWYELDLCGEVHEGLGRLERAVEAYDLGIRLLEGRRSLLHRDDLKVAVAGEAETALAYLRAARACLRLGGGAPCQADRWVARAFGYVERGKARALLDLLAASASAETAGNVEGRAVRRLQAGLSLHRGLLVRERALPEPGPERIGFLERRIDEDEAALLQIEARWRERAGAFPQAEILSLARVVELLPAGSALLLYFFLRDDLMIWGVSSDGEIRTHRAECDTRVLSRQIRQFCDACCNHPDYEEFGHALARLLLAPMAEMVNRHQRLILVPHGAAHLLPFSALPWNGEPLAATHVLSFLPSASSLQFLAAPPAEGPPVSILAVGNPSRMSYRPLDGGVARPLPPLRGAAMEAAFVASLFPEGEVLLEAQATRERVRAEMAGRQVLHFATHGMLWEEAPLLSSIQLADGESLSVAELMGERLDARLVVLSACETGRGSATKGDDVLGLARGLLAAGAGAAIVSLWKVGDASTSLLMGELYRRLRSGDPPAAALQKAQNYLRALTKKDVAGELERLQGHLGPLAARESVARSLQDLRAGGGISSWSGRQPAFSIPCFWASFVLIGGG